RILSSTPPSSSPSDSAAKSFSTKAMPQGRDFLLGGLALTSHPSNGATSESAESLEDGCVRAWDSAAAPLSPFQLAKAARPSAAPTIKGSQIANATYSRN